MNVTISGLKNFRGNEGYGFNANVLIDGRKVALVIDDASGSLYYDWEWVAKTPEQRAADEKAINDYAEAGGFKLYDFQTAVDAMMDKLVENAQLEKQFDKDIKNRVVVMKPDGTVGLLKSTVKPTPENIARAKAAPGLAGHRVINDLPRAEALSLYVAGLKIAA